MTKAAEYKPTKEELLELFKRYKRARLDAYAVRKKDKLARKEAADEVQWVFDVINWHRRDLAKSGVMDMATSSRLYDEFMDREGLIRNPCGGEFTPRSSRVHWSKDPAKRERQRKHIAESIAKRAERNPAHAVHNLVTLLGAALELVVKPPRGKQFSYDWHEDSKTLHALCCQSDLKAVLILEAAKARSVKVPAGAAAERAAWRMWSGFTVDGAIRFSVPSGVAGVHLGAAKVIRYQSDKWTGQDLSYEHRFGAGVQVFADSKRHPRVIYLTADPPKRLVTARGIVG